MGHHIDDEGRFQSDKYPELAPDKVVINLKDPRTWEGLRKIATEYVCRTWSSDDDREFGNDLFRRLKSLQLAAGIEGVEKRNEDLHQTQ